MLIEIKLMMSRITDTSEYDINMLRDGLTMWIDGILTTEEFYEKLLDMLIRVTLPRKGIRWS